MTGRRPPPALEGVVSVSALTVLIDAAVLVFLLLVAATPFVRYLLAWNPAARRRRRRQRPLFQRVGRSEHNITVRAEAVREVSPWAL